MANELPVDWIDQVIVGERSRLETMSFIEVIAEFLRAYNEHPSPLKDKADLIERFLGRIRRTLESQ